MALGFTAEPSRHVTDDAVQDLAVKAVESGTVDARRVSAHYVARYLLANEAHSADDLLSLAQWIAAQGEEEPTEEPSEEPAEEDEPDVRTSTVEGRDWWPIVLAILVGWLTLYVAGVVFGA